MCNILKAQPHKGPLYEEKVVYDNSTADHQTMEQFALLLQDACLTFDVIGKEVSVTILSFERSL